MQHNDRGYFASSDREPLCQATSGALFWIVPLLLTCMAGFPSTASIMLSSGLAGEHEDEAQGWYRFRGPNGSGIEEQCQVPFPWTAKDIAWRIDLPGKGNGSPIVWKDRIFLASANPDTAERLLLCYELTNGKQLWKRSFPSSPHHLHVRSSYASCTPCVDETAVYFCWASPDQVTLLALSHEGQEIWRRDLGRFVSQHGFGASPMIVDDLIILFNSQAAQQLPRGVKPGESRVMAFDRKTGKTRWTTPRATTRACYGVPAIAENGQGEKLLLFSNTGDGIFALKAATGEPQWNRKVFEKRCVSSPILVNDLVIGTEGSGGGGNRLFAVSLDGDHQVQFKVTRAAPYVPTPIAKGKHLFLWSDNGIVSCIETPSGRVLWNERVGGNVSSSPVIAGNKLIGIAEDGTVTVLAASEKFEDFGSARLEDTTRATPLLSRDYALFRTDTTLLCVGKP